MQIDTEEVAGSNPVVPTIFFNNLRQATEEAQYAFDTVVLTLRLPQRLPRHSPDNREEHQQYGSEPPIWLVRALV